MSRRKKKQTKKKRFGLWAPMLVLCLIIAVIGFSSYNMQKTLDEDTAKQEALEAELAAEEERTTEIEEYSKYTKTRKYIEEVAKEKLGLVYEDETVFKDEDSK